MSVDSWIALAQEAAGRPAAVPTRTSAFHSFDGQVVRVALHQRPDRYRQLEAAGFEGMTRIARGAGLSYAPASFGSGILVQEVTQFRRLLEYDESAGSVRVEAGATIGDLLSWALARGRFLPVVPGHPDITVGGCIAADAHGKNPGRDGTFRDWVLGLTLFHPTFGFVKTSPAERRELFDATCGGFGLTGIIVDVTLTLPPLPARAVRLVNQPVASLRQAAEVILTSPAPFCYSWHGALGGSGSIGPGLLFLGDWVEATAPPRRPRRRGSLTAENRGALRACLWNSTTAAAAAHAFYFANRRAGAERVLPIFDCCFPFERRTIYHRLFGQRGLREIQVMIPTAAVCGFLDSLASLLREHRPTVTLTSLKSFRGSGRALSLSGSGLLLAIDFVPGGRSTRFESALDRLAMQLGAQPNVAKDSRVPADVIEATIPTWRSFRATLRQIDPRRLFQSDLSRRLDL